MGTYKVIELLSSSKISWEDATANAVSEASKTLKGVTSVYIQDQSVTVKDGKIDEFRVNVKVSFQIERK